jgi:predicted nucleotidyltransferase
MSVMEKLISAEARTILGVVSAWVEQFECIERMFLFGSVVRGDARPDSDIDLLVQFRGKSVSEMTEYLDSYCAFQNACDSWAKSAGSILGRTIHVHDAVFVDPPDAAAPVVFAAAETALMKIGKAWAVWTQPTPII